MPLTYEPEELLSLKESGKEVQKSVVTKMSHERGIRGKPTCFLLPAVRICLRLCASATSCTCPGQPLHVPSWNWTLSLLHLISSHPAVPAHAKQTFPTSSSVLNESSRLCFVVTPLALPFHKKLSPFCSHEGLAYCCSVSYQTCLTAASPFLTQTALQVQC